LKKSGIAERGFSTGVQHGRTKKKKDCPRREQNLPTGKKAMILEKKSRCARKRGGFRKTAESITLKKHSLLEGGSDLPLQQMP